LSFGLGYWLIDSHATSAKHDCPKTDEAREFTSTAESVIDGDTIVLASGEHARYCGIDAPETHRKVNGEWVEAAEPFGHEAMNRNETLVSGHVLRIVSHGHDHYDRLLITLRVGDTDVVETLLREGLGWFYGDGLDESLRRRYLAAQIEAIDADRGIWPLIGGMEGQVNASEKGIFHMPACYKVGTRYDSALDAFRAGLRPHKGSNEHPGCWRLK
jgi:endonuclease YncB( thermonuclease family)